MFCCILKLSSEGTSQTTVSQPPKGGGIVRIKDFLKLVIEYISLIYFLLAIVEMILSIIK